MHSVRLLRSSSRSVAARVLASPVIPVRDINGLTVLDTTDPDEIVSDT